MVGTVCGSLALLSAWATATAQTVSKSGARNDSDALVEITVTATKRDIVKLTVRWIEEWDAVFNAASNAGVKVDVCADMSEQMIPEQMIP